VSQAARLRELDELAEYHAQRGSDGVTNAARADRNAGDERHSTPPVSPRRGRAVGNNRGRGVQSPVAGPSRGAAATPRSTRSARNAITPEQRTLREFAVQLFNDLSKNVFEGRIGTETDLLWNNRLTRTAGKAHYSRYSELSCSGSSLLTALIRHTNGAFESRIELSTKVVDREGGLSSYWYVVSDPFFRTYPKHVRPWQANFYAVYQPTHYPQKCAISPCG
jgi:hypothetical protein